MANLLVDDRDMEFTLYEQLEIEKFSQADLFQEFDREIFDMVLNEARKFAVEMMYPANIQGDDQGCRLEDGQARVPQPFHELWRLYKEGQWMTVSISPEYEGQGLPFTAALAAAEYFEAANVSFMTYPGLTLGAARLLMNFGTEEQKKKYMTRMLSGQWGGTMALTEAGAGSDVGASKTKAIRRPDGTYSISGAKIFISAGDHDLTENIIHPVLARIEGAPAGTKGLSIFIVPKIRVNADGSLGEPNDVKTGAVEHKLGIKGSATCQLLFGEDGNCLGELLGQENQGFKIMLQMMNEARLGVGHQGSSIASAAYLHALSYAKERLQGSDIKEMRNPEAPRVPIIKHPDVRRMLMYMKAYTEGMRALCLYSAYCIDQERMAADEVEKQKWDGLVALLTPVCKAYCSDMGFRVCETALQVHGGYGYIHEYPAEQYLRDQKITAVYEGTNGIQAMDLLGRKLFLAGGAVYNDHVEKIMAFSREYQNHPVLGQYVLLLEEAAKALKDTTRYFIEECGLDFSVPLFYACPFLELFGDVTVGWLLLWQAVVAQKKLDQLTEGGGDEAVLKLAAESRDAAYYAGKVASARFFSSYVLRLAPGKSQVIKAGERRALDLPDSIFEVRQLLSGGCHGRLFEEK